MIQLSRLGTPLTATAVLLILASNLVQLRHGHVELQAELANQGTALASSARVERQLDALAKGTQQLARAGNPNAQRIVAILREKGVSINGG
ncbi:hypothetical protein KX816_05520 [Sphingosinicellaceae bacterium]|nr:hypothetical protein KX816_05520 [Sphingosinicellaceae bacterium]